jgi:hypothetical protein
VNTTESSIPTNGNFWDADCFGENVKASGYLMGRHGLALSILVCHGPEVGHSYGPLAGSWYGNRVIAAGDGHGEANAYGISTGSVENPDRNLYWMAEQEFEDISYKAVAMLCQGQESLASEMALEAAQRGGTSLLVNLGHVVFLYENNPTFSLGCQRLRRALEEAAGTDWTKRYREFAGKSGYRLRGGRDYGVGYPPSPPDAFAI